MRKMKDSGVAWIGEIPEPWTLMRLCNVTDSIFLGKTPVYSETANDNFIVGQKNNQSYGIDFQGIKYGESSFYNARSKEEFLAFGDVILNTLGGGSVGRIGFWGIHDGNHYLTDGHLMVIRPRKTSCNRFIYYAMLSQQSKLEDDAVGSTNQSFLTVPQVYKNLIAYPELGEQHRIAIFLDAECTRIDSIIEQTRASIEEYKKLKQSVITQAVTKGIRPNRKMKDSGVEWIGEIPEEWHSTSAHRVVTSTQNGLTRRDLEESAGQIVLKLKNISPDGHIDYSSINRIHLVEEELEKYSLKDGDFLFVRVNGSKSLVGKCAIFSGCDEPVAYNDHIIRVRLNNLIDKRYFQYFLLSNIGRLEIDLKTSTAAGQFTISGEGLRNINILLPELDEQQEIVTYLNGKCRVFDNVIKYKTELTTELEAYKKSLIYEYVTGKKEVPA